MIKLRYYTYGDFKRVIKFSDKDFTSMLLIKGLIFSHTNERGDWYKDTGLGVYLKIGD